MDWLTSRTVMRRSWSGHSWYQPSLLTAKSADPLALTETLNGLLDLDQNYLKHDRTTTVKKVQLQERWMVLKRYNARNPGHRIKRAFRQSRANRCWQMAYEFQAAGLNVAQPLIMHEHRWGPVRHDAFFATEFLPGQELLSLLPSLNVQERQSVKRAITQAFTQMRDHKISHGDMKATNLLWVSGALYFVDLDAAQNHASQWSWQRAHGKDKRRFLKNWLAHPDLLALFEFLRD